MNQEYLKKLFYYDDGWLYWKEDRGPKKVKDKKAGSIVKTTGYWRVCIDNKSYALHRLIFLYHHGNLPSHLDHINGNILDNRIENLRPASLSQNCHNSRRYKNSKSGVKGVFWAPSKNKWIARIRMNRKNVFLKYCDTLEEATMCVRQAREKYHGEFTNHGDRS